jgi:cytochrome c oxidase cbb3-type subunit III
MSDILKMASLDSPAAVWIIFLFISVFMGFLFYVALMDKNHAHDMAGKPLDDADLLLDHEIDGIRELDNDLPPWWIKLFYLSIAFAAVYMLGYHVVELWNLPDAEYVEELKAAGVELETTQGTTASLASEAPNSGSTQSAGEKPAKVSVADILKLGKKVYAKNCASCHVADGGGGVGPNFTDKYWIHGGSKVDIVKVINVGVPLKGMIPWKGILKDKEINAVADYILTLEGTTPAAPKAAQGELYTP